MDKPSWTKTYKDLSAHFIVFIQRQYDELHIEFDRYDIPKQHKSAPRQLRFLGRKFGACKIYSSPPPPSPRGLGCCPSLGGGSVVVDILFNVLPIDCGSSVFIFVLLCITLCPF